MNTLGKVKDFYRIKGFYRTEDFSSLLRLLKVIKIA